MRTLVAHGTIVTASETFDADVLIDGERIAAIGAPLQVTADRTLDAAGKLVLPGAIDVHTHLDLPVDDFSSADDFTSGTIAAAAGGTTTIVDYATQLPGQTLRQALDSWHARAAGRAAIDYGFHMAITDAPPAVVAEMATLAAEGVTSFKVYLAYPGRLMLDDGAILRVLRKAAELGALVCVHAENGPAIAELAAAAIAAGQTAPRFHALTRPVEAEREAAARAASLAAIAGAPIHVVHLSSADGLDALSAARDRGGRVLAETCPQYLLLSDELYGSPDFDVAAAAVMSPPLRPAAHQEALWRGLGQGAIQVVATDHCPFLRAHKRRGLHDFSLIPNGAPGIETRLSLIYDAGVRAGRLSLNRFVEVVATAPARLFGLFPRKGVIAPGADADLVIFDPNRTVRLSAATGHSRADASLYEGREVTGAADIVISRGQIVFERDRFVGRAGHGRFVRRRGTIAATLSA